jgi:hypothetical protein
MMHVVTRVTGACAVAALISLIPLQAQQAPSTPLGASAPTPRTADGHPDLSGLWGGGGGAGGADKPDEKGNLRVLFTQRPCSLHQRDLGNCAQAVNFERDSGVEQRMDPIPMYKPEFWERVQYLDREGVKEDPTFHCKPAGVPRMGPPAKIVQTPTELIFLYAQANQFRVIPIDGRAHDRHRRLQRRELDRLAGLVPQQQHARHREVHAERRHADVAGDGRGSRRADAAVCHEAAHGSCEPEREGDAHRGPALRGARQPAHRDARARLTPRSKWKSE